MQYDRIRIKGLDRVGVNLEFIGMMVLYGIVTNRPLEFLAGWLIFWEKKMNHLEFYDEAIQWQLCCSNCPQNAIVSNTENWRFSSVIVQLYVSYFAPHSLTARRGESLGCGIAVGLVVRFSYLPLPIPRCHVTVTLTRT